MGQNHHWVGFDIYKAMFPNKMENSISLFTKEWEHDAKRNGPRTNLRIFSIVSAAYSANWVWVPQSLHNMIIVDGLYFCIMMTDIFINFPCVIQYSIKRYFLKTYYSDTIETKLSSHNSSQKYYWLATLLATDHIRHYTRRGIYDDDLDIWSTTKWFELWQKDHSMDKL